MTLTVTSEVPPLRRDEHGDYRVGNTRLLLDLVVYAYRAGETPEGIVNAYDVLALADVHAVISYYLRHRAAVDEYIAERERQGAELRRRLEARPDPKLDELRARLNARRAAGG